MVLMGCAPRTGELSRQWLSMRSTTFDDDLSRSAEKTASRLLGGDAPYTGRSLRGDVRSV
jgi:hypothetical protein